MLKSILKKTDSRRTSIIYGILAVYAIFLIVKFVKKCLPISDDYTTWAISDWMINYQGGFVRRGIIGELLLQLHTTTGLPPRTMIMGVAGTAFALLIWMLARLFNKQGWSHMLLFAPCLLAMTVPMHGWFWTRRDCLALIITWGIFMYYSRYMRKHDMHSLLVMQILSILTLLIHEASFFFTFPLMFLHAYGHFAYNSRCKLKTLAKAATMLLPAMATMGVVCMYKGDATTAQAIWDSWMPCMQHHPLGEDCNIVGKGVEALAWETLPTFEFHFKENWMDCSKAGIPYFPFTLMKFAALYYLTTRINTVDLKWNVLKTIDRTAMSNVMLVQLFFLIPLFTVLSCDMPRIFGYWVFSTLIGYNYFRNDRLLFGQQITKASTWLQGKMDKAKVLDSPWTYIAVMLCL